MKEIKLTQEFIDESINALIDKIKTSKRQFRYVVGIENGGLHISCKVASALGVEHRSVKISHYDEQNLRNEAIVAGCSYGSNCLVVDDLIDGGNTLRTYDCYFGLKGNAVAVLFWNVKAIIKPDYYVYEKPDAWLTFPWEIK